MKAALILFCAGAVELLAFVLRRSSWPLTGRYLPWVTRPFAVWAAFAAYYEWQSWTAFRRAAWPVFPIYGTAWEQFVPGLPARAIAAATAAAIAIGVLVLALRSRSGRTWLVPLVVAFSGMQLAASLIPQGWEGPLYPWHRRHKVYGEAVYWMQKTPNFVGRFVELQPEFSIHARSHPPGAVVFSYWTVSTRPFASWSNVVVRLAIASLAIPVTFWLGTRLAGRRVGLVAAAFVGSMPAAAAYNTYSMDPIIAVVLNVVFLLVARLFSGSSSAIDGALLGVALFAASMLQFGWPLAAAAAVPFGIAVARSNGVALGAIILRSAIPAAVFATAHVTLRVATGFDYVSAFEHSFDHHGSFYRADSLHAAILGALASPLEIVIGLGPIAAVAAVASLARGGGGLPPALAWLGGAMLLVYVATVIFGPDATRFEAARVWYWLYPSAALVAAAELVRRHPEDDRPLVSAVFASCAATVVLVSLLNFAR